MIRAISLALPFVAATACGGPEPAAPTPETDTRGLIGTWEIYMLKGRIMDGEITLQLRANDTLSGEAPCNGYSGTYSAEQDLSFTVPPVRATRRACPDLALETAYFDALRDVVEFRTSISGDNIRLLDAAGTAVLVFVAAS